MAVVEGTVGMMAVDFPHLTRACREARLEARQSAANGVLDMTILGVVCTESLSEGLFSYEATEKVYTSIPAIIQVPPPQPPRLVMVFWFLL